MFEVNRIYNVDCRSFLSEWEGETFDVVLTSPPYNTDMRAAGGHHIEDSTNGKYYPMCRYDEFCDIMSNDEYCRFTSEIFDGFDKKLSKDGVVLYNISYGGENSECMFLAISDIIRNTEFTIADCIVVEYGDRV